MESRGVGRACYAQCDLNFTSTIESMVTAASGDVCKSQPPRGDVIIAGSQRLLELQSHPCLRVVWSAPRINDLRVAPG